MVKAEGWAESRLGPPSLAVAARRSVGGFVESIHLFVAWNLVLLVAVALTIGVLVVTPLGMLLVPFLAPFACGLLRLAVVTARGEHVTMRSAVTGVTHRWRAKVTIGAAQCGLLLLAVVNLLVAPSMGGLPGAISTAMSVYLVVGVLAYAVALWPLLCDPRRDGRSPRSLARLALVILFRRPLQLGLLTVMLGLAALLIRDLIAPAFFLPGVVSILLAGYVIAAADELDPAIG
jgi:hypothetical protein